MGAGASSIPDAINKEQCQEIVGQAFTEELWLKHSKDGMISKDDLMQLTTIKSTIIVTAVESSGVAGVATFEQTFLSNPTKITYKFSGLTPGLHGFHM
jgi:Cu/Zn superoxide dismutase